MIFETLEKVINVEDINGAWTKILVPPVGKVMSSGAGWVTWMIAGVHR